MEVKSLTIEEIARSKGFISSEQLQEAQLIQAMEARSRKKIIPIKRLLVENGFISDEQLEQVETERLSLLHEIADESVPEEVKWRMRDRAHFVDRFVLIDPLGRGGMGRVWKAYDMLLKRYVAVKFIEEVENVSMVLKEAQTLARLKHPNIVDVYEVGENYIVMQFVQGATLDKHRVDQKEALRIFCEIAGAISYAHENGVIHRDIKPQNIMIETETNKVYVMDFGIARRADDLTATTTSVVGTPSYMAPEQLHGSQKEIDSRTDVYALGALFYSMLTGVPPFRCETLPQLLKKIELDDPVPPKSLNAEIPVEIDSIIRRAMEKSTQQRYQSAREMLADVNRFQNGEPVSVHVSSFGDRLGRKMKKYETEIMIAVLLAAGTLIGGVIFYYLTEWGYIKPD